MPLTRRARDDAKRPILARWAITSSVMPSAKNSSRDQCSCSRTAALPPRGERLRRDRSRSRPLEVPPARPTDGRAGRAEQRRPTRRIRSSPEACLGAARDRGPGPASTRSALPALREAPLDDPAKLGRRPRRAALDRFRSSRMTAVIVSATLALPNALVPVSISNSIEPKEKLVRAEVGRPAESLLGRHVGGRPHHHPGLRQSQDRWLPSPGQPRFLRLHQLPQAEVEDLRESRRPRRSRSRA